MDFKTLDKNTGKRFGRAKHLTNPASCHPQLAELARTATVRSQKVFGGVCTHGLNPLATCTCIRIQFVHLHSIDRQWRPRRGQCMRSACSGRGGAIRAYAIRIDIRVQPATLRRSTVSTLATDAELG